MSSNQSPLTATQHFAGTAQSETAPLLARWQNMSPKVGILRLELIRALQIELTSLDLTAAWSIDGNGMIRGNDPADKPFPGMITLVSRIAQSPAGNMLAQCRSLRQWVFGWRTGANQAFVIEANFRSDRGDMNESDMETLRVLVDTSFSVHHASAAGNAVTTPPVLQHSSTPGTPESAVSAPLHHSRPAESSPEYPAAGGGNAGHVDGSTERQPAAANFRQVESSAEKQLPAAPFRQAESGLLKQTSAANPSPGETLATVAGASSTDVPKTDETSTRKERRTIGSSSTRRTIAIPVGQRRETLVNDLAQSDEKPLSEADTLISLPEVERRPANRKEKPESLSPLVLDSHSENERQPTLPSTDADDEGEIPRAYTEAVAWPQIKSPATKHPPLLSALGMTLGIICTLLSLWVSTVAVPETMASYQAEAQRRRTMSDQTMIRDLSMAMASGDYGDVQTALSSFASLGYFESALVSNTRKRVVAQAGLDTGIRIGDETPPDVKKFARTIDLMLANESQGQLLLLHEGNNEEQQSGLVTIQIGAVIVGVVSFLFSLIIALRLYRAPLARVLLRNR